MTEPIKLAHLRADVQAYIDRQDLWDNGPNAQGYFMCSEIMALIDIAEAAHALLDDERSDQRFVTLHDALARLDFGDTT